MKKNEKIIWTAIMAIAIVTLIVCLVIIVRSLVSQLETDSFNAVMWVANPANPASPVGMLLR